MGRRAGGQTGVAAGTASGHRAAKRADVVVVGGGVVGCSIAYRLAERGRRVLLLERGHLAGGASGRNGGMTGAGTSLHGGSAAGRAVAALTSANLDLLRALPEEVGTDVGLRLPGTLDVAMTPEQHAHVVASVAAQRAMGLDVRLLDRDETLARMPALSGAVLGAAFASGRGYLQPRSLVHAFAAAARRHGATIRTGLAVEGLLRAGDRVVGVRADGAAISAGEVVLATNGYTRSVLRELPAGALVPARGTVRLTAPLPPLLPHPFGTNFDKEYGRQLPGGRVLFGGCRRYDEDEGLGHDQTRVTPAVLDGLARCLGDLFPSLRGVRFERAWSGIMGFTADGLPLIGRCQALPGLTLAAGFNGSGFSWAAVTGRVVADLLADRAPGFDLAPFRPDRFAAVEAGWANPFTAGERGHADVAPASA